MSSAALPAPRAADSTTASGGPAIVTTERLCAVSSDQSSRRTPSTCIAATMRRTLLASVPSEKFGTHSMMASEFINRCERVWLRSLPPGVADRELYACIDAGVLVAERGRGDVNGVGSKIEGAVGFDEVVDAHAELRCEVPDAGVGRGTVVEDVVGRAAEGRVLVVGPNDAAAALRPGREL